MHPFSRPLSTCVHRSRTPRPSPLARPNAPPCGRIYPDSEGAHVSNSPSGRTGHCLLRQTKTFVTYIVMCSIGSRLQKRVQCFWRTALGRRRFCQFAAGTRRRLSSPWPFCVCSVCVCVDFSHFGDGLRTRTIKISLGAGVNNAGVKEFSHCMARGREARDLWAYAVVS